MKYFKRGEARGNLIAGFDVNSDRIDMVVVDEYGRTADTRTEWSTK
ncbi:MAG: hypothetical protein QXX81_06840 [Zestosphaera sp.]